MDKTRSNMFLGSFEPRCPPVGEDSVLVYTPGWRAKSDILLSILQSHNMRYDMEFHSPYEENDQESKTIPPKMEFQPSSTFKPRLTSNPIDPTRNGFNIDSNIFKTPPGPFPKQTMLATDDIAENVVSTPAPTDIANATGGITQVMIEKDSATSLRQYCCDGCSTCPILRLRWHCTECRDFDLCEACYKVLDADWLPPPHSRDHPMSAIPIEMEMKESGNFGILFDGIPKLHKQAKTEPIPREPKSSKANASTQRERSEHLKKVYVAPKPKSSESLLESLNKRCPPGGGNSVIVYTTTGGNRKPFKDSNKIRSLLHSHYIQMFERDIFTDAVSREQLKELMGYIKVPLLFVKGRLVGGADEVTNMEENGDLDILFDGIPKLHKQAETKETIAKAEGEMQLSPTMNPFLDNVSVGGSSTTTDGPTVSEIQSTLTFCSISNFLNFSSTSAALARIRVASRSYNQIKLLLIGDNGVGKRFLHRRFSSADSISDTSMSNGIYYESSFNNIKNCISDVKHYARDNVYEVLVGNKADMGESERVVSTSEGQALADEYGIKFFETSALIFFNVKQVFLSTKQKTVGRTKVLLETVPVHRLADIFVASFEISFEEQLSMLDSVDLKVRLLKATELVDRHLQSIRVAEKITQKVEGQLSKSQKEFLLRQQMRAIKEELGDNDDDEDDVAALERGMQSGGMPPNVWKHAQRDCFLIFTVVPFIYK
ncbi:hypothetical protein IFM89_003341 [Coptis chinensis]|uniref:Auxin transport protein BIG n=1 Tax=Coptis chinensis TaxID=261450 RepID=A0A835ISY6_9MAGN|nr:hypothetical protein IFM89_003341 [Coptis chinensis]